MADKKFKPHMMYSRDGEEEMANTLADHERLSKTKTKRHSPAPFKLREVNSPMKCWKTHKQMSYKKKGGRTVPNCVPK